MGDGSSDDDGAIVREATPEVELGPPLDLAAPFVPRPATESLWLIRVCAARLTALPARGVRYSAWASMGTLVQKSIMMSAATPGRMGKQRRSLIVGHLARHKG